MAMNWIKNIFAGFFSANQPPRPEPERRMYRWGDFERCLKCSEPLITSYPFPPRAFSPTYVSDGTHEHLQWQCPCCGWRWRTTCHDSGKVNPLVNGLENNEKPPLMDAGQVWMAYGVEILVLDAVPSETSAGRLFQAVVIYGDRAGDLWTLESRHFQVFDPIGKGPRAWAGQVWEDDQGVEWQLWAKLPSGGWKAFGVDNLGNMNGEAENFKQENAGQAWKSESGRKLNIFVRWHADRETGKKIPEEKGEQAGL